MGLRHEVKYEISLSDMLILRQRLSHIMKNDSHATNGVYEIRSLYFDTDSDKALREKTDGVNMRSKYRIRLYNRDTGFIVLERKSKINNMTKKDSVRITEAEARRAAVGDFDFMLEDERPLLSDMYIKMKNEGLRAKTVIDYTREPFVFPAGDVRVTIDYNIRTGLSATDFLNFELPTVPACGQTAVLEIKWSEFLPDIIKDAVHLDGRKADAFSKYAAGRVLI